MPPTKLAHLAEEEWERLQKLADRFEGEWRRGPEPRLEDFLPALGDPLRRVALHELIKTDLEIRWKRRQPVLLEAYLERFPDLGGARQVAPGLILEEYRVRQDHGDRPGLADYRSRFPEQFAELERLASAADRDSPGPAPARLKPLTGSLRVAAAPPAGQDKPAAAPEFELLRRLGGGGFGEVWEARAPGGFPAAVKIIFRTLDHEEAQRELKSLEAICGLRHSYLLSTLMSWCQDGRLYIAMELADGTLRDRLKECQHQGQRGMPFWELLRWFGEAAEALDYLHAHRVFHCDVKPDNLLLLGGHVKVADFGLARPGGPEGTVDASAAGTAPYMAPEVFWENKYSERSDLYSLAVSYAELRLGRRPFSGSSMMELMQQHRDGLPDLADLLPVEQEVILKALSKDRSRRHATCLEFASHLEQALHGAPLPDGRPFRGPGGSSAELPTLPNDQGRGLAPPAARPRDDLDHTARPETAGATGAGSQTADDTPRPGGWKGGAPADTEPFPGERPRRRRPWAVALAGGLVLILLAAVGFALKFWPTTTPDPGTGPTPADPGAFLPPGCVRVEGAKVRPIEGGRVCYDRVAYRLDDGTLVPFILVPKDWGSDPRGLEVPSFCIMEDKVAVGLYKKFAAARQPLNPEWEKGARLAGGKDLGIGDERLPVLGVKAADAHRFAQWLKGRLPSVEQWNKAAGAYAPEEGKGPFLGVKWQPPAEAAEIGLNRARGGPLPVGTAARDVTSLGCRDLAGNGQELTRNLVDTDETVPLRRKPEGTDRVVVRGCSFDKDSPPAFEDLLRDDLWHSVPYEAPSRDTGFRVVIDLAP